MHHFVTEGYAVYVTFVKRFLLECDGMYSGTEAPSFWSDTRSREDSIMPQGTT